MSTSTKWALGIVVLAIIALGVWFVYQGKNNLPQNYTGSSLPANTVQSTTSPSQTVSSRDDSDASLDADMSTINGQMNTADSNSASFNQSLNDTPVSQTE